MNKQTRITERIRRKTAAFLTALAAVAWAAMPAVAEMPDYLVEWVQPSASLYVDTGVKGKCGVKAEVKFAHVYSGEYPVMLGSWGGDNKRFNIVMDKNEQARWEYGNQMNDLGNFAYYGSLVTVEVEVSAAGAMTGKPAATNLPKGWTVRKSADGKTLTIKRSAGVKIIVY